MNKIEMRKEEERWAAEADMRTLAEADKIRSDPKRLKRAQECAKQKLMEIAAVAGATGVKADNDC
jgi:hypothetical protein